MSDMSCEFWQFGFREIIYLFFICGDVDFDDLDILRQSCQLPITVSFSGKLRLWMDDLNFSDFTIFL